MACDIKNVVLKNDRTGKTFVVTEEMYLRNQLLYKTEGWRKATDAEVEKAYDVATLPNVVTEAQAVAEAQAIAQKLTKKVKDEAPKETEA